MATGLHLATVGFSVRNALAEMGASSAPEVWNRLLARWNRSIDLEEIFAALRKLVELGMVRQVGEHGGHFEALAPRRFTSRGRAGSLELAQKHSPAWEGWH